MYLTIPEPSEIKRVPRLTLISKGSITGFTNRQSQIVNTRPRSPNPQRAGVIYRRVTVVTGVTHSQEAVTPPVSDARDKNHPDASIVSRVKSSNRDFVK